MLKSYKQCVLLILAAFLLGGCVDGVLSLGQKKERNSKDVVYKAPYPPSTTISGLELEWKTHNRLAGGSDNWPTTWAGDNNIYTAWGDGGGFGGGNFIGRSSLGVARVSGDWPNYHAINLWGGNDALSPATAKGKSYGILAIDKTLYMWVSPDDGKTLYYGSRLYRSNDLGLHWQPAEWEFSRQTELLTPTFLQFGRGYEGARDDYVYIYANHLSSPNFERLTAQKPGAIFLLRALASRVFDREAYEFFSGFNTDKSPKWTTNIADKKPVFENPQGVGWNSSAIYHPTLKRYLLFTEHSATFSGNIAIFDAPEPWGPWSTVMYETGFGEGIIEGTTFYWNLPAKWLGVGGDPLAFVMAFTGIESNDSWNTVEGVFLTPKP